MPTLNRRLQVLIDEERFARVERNAHSAGISVGEFVRRALDAAVNADDRPSKQRDVVDMFLAAPRMDLGASDEMRDLLDEAHTSHRSFD